MLLFVPLCVPQDQSLGLCKNTHMQNTPPCFLFLCLRLKLFLFHSNQSLHENTLTHKAIWSSEGWKKHPCPPPTSTEVLSHLCDSDHKCSTLEFFAILTRTWQKIFCCVNSEMGTWPSGDHASAIPSPFLKNNLKNEEKKPSNLSSCDRSLLHYCHNCTLRFLSQIFFYFFF